MKWLKFYWMWFLYRIATSDERFLYDMAQIKGFRAEGVRNGIIKYSPGLPPQERDFLTWAEYKLKHTPS